MRARGVLTILSSLALGCGQASSSGGTSTPEDVAGVDTAAPDVAVAPEDVPPKPAGTKAIGAPCTSADECIDGTCLTNGLVPGGYCAREGCDACPAGSSCLKFPTGTSYCLKACASHAECAAAGVTECTTDGVCWLGTPMSLESPVGGPCNDDSDCVDEGATCYPETLESGSWTGFVQGYCLINDCTKSSCPKGSTCQQIYQSGGTACVAACDTGDDCRNDGGYGCLPFDTDGVCWPSCGDGSSCPDGYGCDSNQGECIPACTETSCPTGKVCGADGVCKDPPCTATSCPASYLCTEAGVCVPDMEGGPGAGPGPECPDLPERDCVGTKAYCGELIQYDPHQGPGYDDYQINGEGKEQYRSWARRDLVMLIKWATALVDCKAADWDGGNGKPLGLGDMSEKDGSIPGTSIGEPGHPEGTHVDGYDTDIAYFQNAPPDNKLRPICDHVVNGKEQYHCTGAPYLLDIWRHALLLGAFFSSSRTRVIGVDGKVGEIMVQALQVLCGNGWLPETNCSKVKSYALAWELTDGGAGWYLFHLHHSHISLKGVAGGKPGVPEGPLCLVPDCTPAYDGVERPAPIPRAAE